ncbi:MULTISPECIES: succinate dehydrogenase, hydrophobic membrane anchor protein [Afifella]|uniref:succinate dehydrogenase, hydrophobic membrane anchor protein n=1 Tax=Afifella TaxID=643217 RepID=UPI000FE36F70|nr:succinate dehydrogenase, hydrophobic membrane anchor protein [Afifella aestuarii]
MRTPLAKARGRGSAKEGTGHFMQQRITAFANIPLVLAFLLILASLIGADYQTAHDRVANPFIAAILIGLTFNLSLHMRIGMESVIEDYIHHEGLKVLSYLANTLFTYGMAILGILSILIIALGG